MDLVKLAIPLLYLVIALQSLVPAIINFRDCVADIHWAEQDPVGRASELTVAWSDWGTAAGLLFFGGVFFLFGLWGTLMALALDLFDGQTALAGLIFFGLMFAIEIAASIVSWDLLRKRQRLRGP